MTITPVRVGGEYVFNAFLHDISERKQAEETIRRLADIVESSHDAIIATTPGGRDHGVERGRRRSCTATRAEEVDRAEPRSADAARARAAEDARLLSQALAGRRLEDHETEHRRKDGSLVDVSLTVSPMRDARRAIVGASLIVRDITERKRAEEALREVQEGFRRAFEDAPIGMALFGVAAGGPRAACSRSTARCARSPATRRASSRR